ncbi:TPA: glycosyltransferase family 2 protein [Burkholderia cenocepacia]|uniref:glycosyltransferase family 2 protein n=2 Tax=Burkholderia cenocepacia TaxID=95486 RepID=UPI0009822EC3|nr:glycosyltransferase family 2 protein [Burkholderia cenocepacia]MEB2601446.1 glycosyltransferase family 2 protein [Burkholderia cenocepacia]PRF77165.1 glycosyl transferase family 2 [Burkholderia cenocepacia]RQU39859.1 glycosyltransferase [Burkholderia cenocepacia]
MIDLEFFRLSWNMSHLRRIPDDTDQPKNSRPCKSYAVCARVKAGWYMLELRASAAAPSVKVRVVATPEGGEIESFSVTTSTRHISKRLIRLSSRGSVSLQMESAHPNDEVTQFRLARVTGRFARSRMYRKLSALHPMYKLEASDSSSPRKANAGPARDMWHDYCQLFENPEALVDYSDWVECFDTPNSDSLSRMSHQIGSFRNRPIVALAMALSRPNAAWLNATILHVKAQIYPDWELHIVPPATVDPEIQHLLEHHALSDNRVRILPIGNHATLRDELTDALTRSGSWIAILGQHDLLPRHALFTICKTIDAIPYAELIYSDEDRIDDDGSRQEPHFKCDWNEDLFLARGTISHLSAYHARLFTAAGGWDPRPGFAPNYDLALRCIGTARPNGIVHIPRILYHGRSSAQDQFDTATDADKQAGYLALVRHLQQTGIAADASITAHGYRVHYRLPEPGPMVSIIIPTRNGLSLLRQCIESILQRTTYSNYEIIVVDNGSDERETLDYLATLSTHERILIVRDDRPFNYSALNNRACARARGDYIALVNNDIEVISPGWLEEMLGHATRPEVGAVGAKLLYSDDTVQHAGVILGLSGAADHLHRGLRREDPGYQARAAVVQSLSAVTAACLVVRKSLYVEIGGLNEVSLPVAFNDIDFCLRIKSAGYRIIWTPFAELYHHESATRGEDDTPEKKRRSDSEVAYMRRHWADFMADDPAYNPNLTLAHAQCQIAWPPRARLGATRTAGAPKHLHARFKDRPSADPVGYSNGEEA